MTAKGHEEALGGDGYVHYPDCGDDSMGVCICQNSSNYTLCAQFVVCQLCLNEAIKILTKNNYTFSFSFKNYLPMKVIFCSFYFYQGILNLMLCPQDPCWPH